MLTEFEIRREVEAILQHAGKPMSKVRKLLKLARPLKDRSRVLSHSQAVSARSADGFTSAHLDRLIRRLKSLYEDVRSVAYRLLSGAGVGSQPTS